MENLLNKFDGFVKNPSAALRFNFVVAEGRGGSPSRPISGLRALHLELFTKPSLWRLLKKNQV